MQFILLSSRTLNSISCNRQLPNSSFTWRVKLRNNSYSSDPCSFYNVCDVILSINVFWGICSFCTTIQNNSTEERKSCEIHFHAIHIISFERIYWFYDIEVNTNKSHLAYYYLKSGNVELWYGNDWESVMCQCKTLNLFISIKFKLSRIKLFGRKCLEESNRIPR